MFIVKPLLWNCTGANLLCFANKLVNKIKTYLRMELEFIVSRRYVYDTLAKIHTDCGFLIVELNATALECVILITSK